MAEAETVTNMGDTQLRFIRLAASGDMDEILLRVATDNSLARTPAIAGATRNGTAQFFLPEIAHYIYAGDTPLHIAAAAFRRDVAKLLVAHGADCHARNRRGAQPLHYAADANRWSPAAQSDVIGYLTSIGADANATDKSGVTPLHRAIRTRSLPAVQALLTAGADPNQRNDSGSTPLHLAVRTTGRGGSGTDLSREQQEGIVRLLITVGARPTDRDGRGTTALDAAPNPRIRAWLA